uniref:Uncharacterized protein n=1 Tax=Anguilla anguilla TaxID=7936 RepID=A0A0E9TSP0_ANGAN
MCLRKNRTLNLWFYLQTRNRINLFDHHLNLPYRWSLKNSQ